MTQIQAFKKGTSLLRNSLPNIKEIKPETLKLIPPKKAKKPLSDRNIMIFRQYMLALKNNTKITQEEIKELFSFEGEEFEDNAFEFLIKKLNIPDSIRPGIMKVPMIVANAPAAYVFACNCIFINQQNKTLDKASYLSLLRHELQHFLQNMQILRCEKTGEKAIECYTEQLCQTVLQNYENMVKNLTLEQIQQSGVDEDEMNICKELKELLSEGKIHEYEQKLAQVGKLNHEQTFAQLSEIRKNAIAEMGIIKEGSKECKRAEKFFNEIQISYFVQDNKVDYGEYYMKCAENEACMAQGILLCNLLGEKFCFPQKIQESIKTMSSSRAPQDIEIKAELDKKSEEIKNNGTFKNLVSYLFD